MASMEVNPSENAEIDESVGSTGFSKDFKTTGSDTHPQYPEYAEHSTTQSVPTKFDNDMIMSDQPFSEGRPASAGTIGTAMEVDPEQDEAFLAKMAASPKKEAEAVVQLVNQAGHGLSFLQRDATHSNDIGTDFSFGIAKAASLNLTGTRRGPLAAMQPDHRSPPQHHETPAHDIASAEMLQAKQVEAVIAGPPGSVNLARETTERFEGQMLDRVDHPGTEYQGQAAPPTAKKRKKSKKRQREPPQAEPPFKAAEGVALACREVPEYGGNDAIGNQNDGTSAEILHVHQPDRPATIQKNAHAEKAYQQHFSPHEQLHGDLEADTYVQQQQQSSNGIAEATEDGQPGVMDHLPQQPSLEHNCNRLLQANPETDHGPPDDNVVAANHAAGNDAAGNDAAPPVRKKRKRASAARDNGGPAQPPEGDALDFLQVLAHKLRNMRDECDARILAAESEAAEFVQSTAAEKQAMQADLAAATSDRDQFAAECEKQSEKLKELQKAVNACKKWVAGLKHDYAKLDQGTESIKHKIESLANGSVFEEQAVLIAQLRVCADKSSATRDQALETCRTMQTELQAANYQIEYLSKQLSDNAGMLTEERDRNVQLQGQLSAAMQSETKILRALKTSADGILDKLFLLHAMVETNQKDSSVSEMLQQTLIAVQSVKSGSVDVVEHISSVKSLVESLSERLNEQAGSFDSAIDSLKPQREPLTPQTLQEALSSLKGDLAQSHDLMQKDAKSRETIARLDEQIKAFEAGRDECTSQLKAAQQAQADLKKDNSDLQAKLAARQSRSSPVHEAHAQLGGVNAELEELRAASISAKSDVNKKSEELRGLNEINKQLSEQLSSLKQELDRFQSQAADFDRERQELLRAAEKNEQQVRREMCEHVEQVELKIKMEAKNDLKKLSSERGRLAEQVKTLQEDLELSNLRAQQVQQEANSSATARQELERLKKHAGAQKQEIEMHQATIVRLQIALKDGDAVKQQHARLSSELSAEQSQMQAIAAEKADVVKELRDVQRLLDDAKKLAQQTRDELEESHAEHDAAVKAHQTETNEAEQRKEAGWKRYKATCDEAIAEINSSTDRKIQALQKSLAEVQAEKIKAKAEDDNFRKQVEESWQQEQENNDRRMQELKTKIAEVEAERDGARAELQRICAEKDASLAADRSTLQGQVAEMQQRAQNAERKHAATEGQLKEAQALLAAHATEGLTPTLTSKPAEPHRPRKRVDRNTNRVIEVEPIRVPEQLRPDSRRTTSAGSRKSTGGKVLDRGRLESPNPFAVRFPMQPPPGQSSPPSTGMEDIGDILTIRPSALQLRPPQIVEETQFEDQFADVPLSMAALTSGQHQSSMLQGFDPSQIVSHLGRKDNSLLPGDFTMWEDSQDFGAGVDAHEFEGPRQTQDEYALTPAELDKFTFRKPVAHPNSASKRVQPGVKSLNETRRSETPGIQLQSKVRAGSSHSSSPGFMKDDQGSSRKYSTSALGLEAADKRRLSRAKMTYATDPRLSQKRKSDAIISQGYEQERKKRVVSSVTLPGASSRSGHQNSSSRKDVNPFPTMPAGPRTSSQYGSSSGRPSNHMRTLAGASSRTLRAPKKLSKNDKYNARFSQELDHA